MKIDEKELNELNNNDQPYFSQSGRGIFVGFEYRFLSLRRYINYTHLSNQAYLEYKQKDFNAYKSQFEAPEERFSVHPSTGQKEEYPLKEMTLIPEEELLSDQKHFNEHLYTSLFTLIYSVFEDFLNQLTSYAAELNGIAVNISPYPGRMPEIQKRLEFLKYSCGLDTNLDKEFRDELHLHRKIRNEFIHSLEEDLPKKVRKEIEKLVDSPAERFEKPDYEFVMRAYDTFTGITFRIEEAFEKRFFTKFDQLK